MKKLILLMTLFFQLDIISNSRAAITEAMFILMNRQKSLLNLRQRLLLRDTISNLVKDFFSAIIIEIEEFNNIISADISSISNSEDVDVYNLVEKSNNIIDKLYWQINCLTLKIEIDRHNKTMVNLQKYLTSSKLDLEKLEQELKTCKDKNSCIHDISSIKKQITNITDQINDLSNLSLKLNSKFNKLKDQLKKLNKKQVLPKIKKVNSGWFLNKINSYKQKF